MLYYLLKADRGGHLVYVIVAPHTHTGLALFLWEGIVAPGIALSRVMSKRGRKLDVNERRRRRQGTVRSLCRLTPLPFSPLIPDICRLLVPPLSVMPPKVGVEF